MLKMAREGFFDILLVLLCQIIPIPTQEEKNVTKPVVFAGSAALEPAYGG